MRILIIEDESKVGRFIQNGLKEQGFTTVLVNNGREGMSKILVEDFDCIILDRKLPGIPGIDVCKNIRSNEISTPILFLTVLGEVSDRVEGLEAGADDYLTKPFSIDELIARVHALIRRTSMQKNPSIQIGNVLLDPIRHKVSVNDVDIFLSQREFILLEYLMRNAGRALSRAQILEHVWGYDFAPDSNVIDVYINYIRKKIDQAGQKSYIKTIRGMGYLFLDHVEN